MINALDLVSPKRYAEQGRPHDEWTLLRKEAPVYYCEPEGYKPFWAITKHADISEISKQPTVFLSAPRTAITTIAEDEARAAGPQQRTLVNMDLPDHRTFRKIASSWFTPRHVAALEARMVDSARRLTDKLATKPSGEAFDFVNEVAAPHPLRLIAHLFGLPETDEPFVLQITNEIFGSEDPEFKRAETSHEHNMQLLGEAFAFFGKIAEDRRANPTDDLATAIVQAHIDKDPIEMGDVLGYYLIILTAGHETTRNAISGGLLALMENPEELAKLRADPSLAESAADEIVRWTTPVNQFARTAAQDYELRGQTIKAGQDVALFYGSANRDEEIFEDPFSFRIERSPNNHLGFGIGEHFCLGASLARMEIRVLLEELIPRLEEIDLAGEPARLASSFVGGIKHLPVSCKVA